MDNTWNPKQIKTDKERIIALETTLVELKAGNPTAGNNNNNNNGNNGNNRSNNRQGQGSSSNKWAWKKVAPHTSAAHTIKKNNKEYHWCPKHKQWCIHLPAECHLDTTVANAATIESEHPVGDNSVVTNDPALQSIIGGVGRIFD
jgi:hypothetical protein